MNLVDVLQWLKMPKIINVTANAYVYSIIELKFGTKIAIIQQSRVDVTCMGEKLHLL